jgi:hypothetical protein
MPPTLMEIVVDLMAQLPALSLRMPVGLPELSRRLGVLPLTWDMGGCRALRPTGEIVSWPWDEEYKLSVERSQLERNRAMFQGALKYPTLHPFLPARPSDAQTCTQCAGTGKPSGLPEAFAGQFVCLCGGAGWLPAGEVGV